MANENGINVRITLVHLHLKYAKILSSTLLYTYMTNCQPYTGFYLGFKSWGGGLEHYSESLLHKICMYVHLMHVCDG